MKWFRIIAASGVTVFGGSCAIHAQASPEGTYRASNITVEFTNERATFSNARGLMISAAYRVSGDTIQLRDESGPAACLGETGRYQWRLQGDTLRFRMLEDSCSGRRSALSAGWVRVASALVLTGATVIDGTGTAPRSGMTIVMRDGIITALYPDGTAPIPAGADVRNSRDRWIIPGLIDAHVHLATDPNGPDRRDRVERRLRNALLGGIVAVRDMGGDGRALGDLSRAAMTGQIVSPIIRYSAIMAGPEFFSDPRVRASSAGVAIGAAPWARAITNESDVRQVVAEAKGAGATGVKLYTDLDSLRMAKVAAEAKRQGLAVWAHAASNLATPSAVAGAGIEVMSHSVLLTREATPPAPAGSGRTRFDDTIGPDHPAIKRAVAAMVQNGTTFEPTLFVFRAAPGAADTSLDRRRAKRATEFVRVAHEAGVRILAGTDGMGGENDGDVPNLHEELALLVNAGLTPMDAIVAATSTGAKTLRLEATHGTIAVGKSADLVLLTADPLKDIRNTRAIAGVIQRGRLVVK